MVPRLESARERKRERRKKRNELFAHEKYVPTRVRERNSPCALVEESRSRTRCDLAASQRDAIRDAAECIYCGRRSLCSLGTSRGKLLPRNSCDLKSLLSFEVADTDDWPR